jgi:hypothetical protein
LSILPGICFYGLLLVYTTVLIYKTSIQNNVYGFILTLLVLVALSSFLAVVYGVLEYKASALYLTFFTGSVYTPAEAVAVQEEILRLILAFYVLLLLSNVGLYFVVWVFSVKYWIVSYKI